MKKTLTTFVAMLMSWYVMADTEVVGGIEWTYEIIDGTALIGGTGTFEKLAVPTTTTGEITIPEALGNCPVTSIGNYAFKNCCRLTGVTIPSNVVTIGYWAFDGCSGLKNVIVSSGLTYVDASAFCDCVAIRSATLPGSNCGITLTSITNLVISEGTTSIKDSAFANCAYLANVTISESVTSIGGSAFSGCSSLTKISLPSNLTSIGSMAFSGCSGLAKVIIPDGVTSIGSSAFKDCTGLKAVEIPDSVVSIGNNAFDGCSALQELTIPASVSLVDDSAFAKCGGMTNIVFKGDIPDFGDNVFEGTPKRMTINVPSDGFGWDYYEKYGLVPPWGIRNVVVTKSADAEGENEDTGSCANVNLAVTNIVVHYIQTSELSPMAAPITKDVGIVNVMTEVKGGNVSIPESWATNYPTFKVAFGTDFSTALTKTTNKFDAGGNPMMVWQDFVAGTDPTDETDVFRASVTMVDGNPVVSYTPKLSDEEKAKRKYTTWGKARLQDADWLEVQSGHESDYNFFKVTVEMK